MPLVFGAYYCASLGAADGAYFGARLEGASREEAAGEAVIGLVGGAIGGRILGRCFAMLKGVKTGANGTTNVSRWGQEGLEAGDWVMKGAPTRLNFGLSGKGSPLGNNQTSTLGSGQEFWVDPAHIRPPGPGDDPFWWVKRGFGQGSMTQSERIESAFGALSIFVLICASVFIVANWYIVLWSYFTKKSSSVIPFAGGIVGLVGALLSPLPIVRSLWWLPLVLDLGSPLWYLIGQWQLKIEQRRKLKQK